MLRIAVLLTAVLVVVQMCGCGGSDGGSQGTGVRIESTQLSPQTINISPGDRVQWTNTSGSPQQIVSGTLLPTTSPQVRTPVILINQNNTFAPDTFQANLGDTVQWQNNRTGPFTLEIVNESGVVVQSLSFVQTGQIIRFAGFPNAGFYTFRQANNVLFSGTVTVFGRPNPDNRFQSLVLNNGGTFTSEFDFPGTFPYFVQNSTNPNLSFMTGTVVVQ